MTGTLGQAFWVLYALGAIATALGSLAFWWPRSAPRAAASILAVGFVDLAGSVAVRWAIVGRPPVIGTFENTLVTATLVVGTALVLSRFGPPAKRPPLPGLLAPWALALLAGGQFARRAPLPIDAGGRAVIGYVHAFVGWLDFAILLGSLAAAIGVLAYKRSAGEGADEGIWDEALARLLGLGFALLTATMASGSIYSFILFGEWYRWQVVESAAAVAWLAYASLLHLRLLHRWRGQKLARATLAAFPLAVIAFWVWAVYPATYHYFDAVLRIR